MKTMADERVRQTEYDFVRVVAMLFVIAVHSLPFIGSTDPISLFYYQCMQVIFFTCNGMFYMLSGHFSLSKPQVDYRKYYLSKARKIVFPMLVAFFVRTLYQRFFAAAPSSMSFWQEYGRNLLGDFMTTEYWFLFLLLGNLLVAPLLAKAFAVFSRKEHILFVGLALLFFSARWLTTIFALPFSYSYIFEHWSFYFYFGYCLERIIRTKKEYILLLCAGVACLACTVVLKYKGITVFVHDLSPLFIVITAGAYLAFLKLGKRLRGERTQRIIRVLSQYSFLVYLIHMMVLERFKQYILFMWGPLSPVGHLLITGMIFVVSFAIAVICRKLWGAARKAAEQVCHVFQKHT